MPDYAATTWPPRPAEGDEAPTAENVRWAIRETEWMYLCYEEFIAAQDQAVATLVNAAKKVLS